MMARKLQKLMDATSDGVSFDLPEDVDWQRPHVFVSNHRDIILDAALLELIFSKSGLEQPAALAGSNLMTNDVMIKFSRLNRIFCMERGDGSKRAFYESLQHTSQQVRALVDEGTSVWIAQRNGRTKDGRDKTDPAVLKMLCLSGRDKLQTLLELGVTPMSISYEWEPCDMMKAREMMMKARDGVYHKVAHEDEQSILTGLQQQKGRVHVAIGHPLTAEQLEGAADAAVKAAALIDEQIWRNYRLWPNNYIAYAMSGYEVGEECYTADEKMKFEQHLAQAPELRDWLLRIYGGPVESKNNEIIG